MTIPGQMTLNEIRQTAFAHWLRQQPRLNALGHLYDSLRLGDADNLAWQLWARVHGDRTFPAAKLPEAIEVMLDALSETETETEPRKEN